MGRRIVVLVAAIGLVLLPGPGAGAQVGGPATIYATPGSLLYGYATPVAVIEVGGDLEFRNLDLVAPHNVTALDEDADGEPLFSSDTISADRTVTVKGTENLDPASTYRFFCTVHPHMSGVLLTQPAD